MSIDPKSKFWMKCWYGDYSSHPSSCALCRDRVVVACRSGQVQLQMMHPRAFSSQGRAAGVGWVGGFVSGALRLTPRRCCSARWREKVIFLSLSLAPAFFLLWSLLLLQSGLQRKSITISAPSKSSVESLEKFSKTKDRKQISVKLNWHPDFRVHFWSELQLNSWNIEYWF